MAMNGVSGWSTRLARRTLSVRLFVRFSAMGFSMLVVLLPTAASGAILPWTELLLLIGVAVTFHCFAYVHNDVVDLPVDRREPRRRDFPLVTGAVRSEHALAFAVANVPAALACAAALGADGRAFAALAAAFLCAAIYNVWSKRIAIPVLADALQAAAWAMLSLFGALASVRRADTLSLLIAAFIFAFVLLSNGVHGGLRDLAGDLASGVRSTAILLGARPDAAGGRRVPPRLAGYALVLQTTLVLLAAAMFADRRLAHGAAWGGATIAFLSATGAASVVLLVRARAARDAAALTRLGIVQLMLSLSLLLVVLAPSMHRRVLLVSWFVFLTPALTHSAFIDALRLGVRFLIRRQASAAPSASPRNP